SKAEDRVWWSGGGNGFLHEFELKGDRFTRRSKTEADPSQMSGFDILRLAEEHLAAKKSFKSGLCLDEARGVLYSLDINAGTISALDSKGKATRTGELGGRPYDVVVGPGGHLLYVSDWSRKQVLAVDPTELRAVARIAVGDHPNQIAVHPKDGRLFVACGSSNGVWVIEPKRGIVTEVISTSLFP